MNLHPWPALCFADGNSHVGWMQKTVKRDRG